MRTTDLIKLRNAGYTIVRADDYPRPRIKKYADNSSWVTVENFDTKAARDRALAKMLEDDKTLLD